MKRRYINIAAGVLMVFLLGSCKKYLDINVDPNNTLSGDPKALFSFASASFVNNRAGGDLYIPLALGGQSISGGGSSTEGISWGNGSEDSYVFSEFSFGNIWTQYYTSVGFNLKNAITLAENGAPRNNNGAAQAKVLLAETIFELTCLYGDIPYKEAFRIETSRAPHFDSQKEVMDSALALIDQALLQFDDDDDAPRFENQYDMFYAGDIEKWIKAARSLKLRILMTMVDKEPAKATLIGTLVTQGGFIEAQDDNMKIGFELTAGKRNPKYAINLQYNGGTEFFYGSPYVVDYLNANNDPRRPFFFDRPQGVTDYIGITPGEDADDEVHAKLAATIHTANQPEYVFTYQEQLFYLAEIYARGLGVTANLVTANNFYKEAVRQSCIFWGVSGAVADDYVNNDLEPLTSMSSPALALREIHYQHWVDKMDRGIDAFTQWRRSGPAGSEVPTLAIPPSASETSLFRSYQYPAASETAANPNAPATTPFTTKLWFDL